MSHINLFLTLLEDSLAVLTAREESFTVKSPESHLAQSYDAQTFLMLYKVLTPLSHLFRVTKS